MTKLIYPVPGLDSYHKGKPEDKQQTAIPPRKTIVPLPTGTRPASRAPLRTQRTAPAPPAPSRTPLPPAKSPAAPTTVPSPTTSILPSINSPRHIPAPPGYNALNLEQFLHRYSDLPPHTAALGYCDDKLPVLFDFTQTSAGPLLILGDHRSGKTNLLRVLLTSAARTSNPQAFKYLIIGSNPDEYASLAGDGAKAKHCLDLLGTYDQQAPKAIVRMAALAEERYNQQRVDPPTVVVIDDLKFITNADTDVRLNFEWLVQHGPAVRVWPVVALQTEAALDMGRWTARFRTRIIGKMPEKAANRLGMYSGSNAGALQAGKQFGVYVNQDWMRFWVPFAGASS